MRPISLSSSVGKILERMINERIIWKAEREGWFDVNQNGFRRGRSCGDNLSKLVSEIELCRETNLNLTAVFLDIKSAYDNIKCDILCDILLTKRCPIRIVRYIDT